MSKYFRRKRNVREEYRKIYIFTEGEKTEAIYFNAKKKEIEKELRRQNIKIEIMGTGFNTKSLVNYALAFVDKNRIDLTLDECWVVFDKDDFDRDFDDAINKALSKNLKVAYSNEAFELWFLLHFSYMSSALNRKTINQKLGNYLKVVSNNKKYRYSKIKNIYNLIKLKESRAIKNAERLLQSFKNEVSFLRKNPSTTVHQLVKTLNELKNDK